MMEKLCKKCKCNQPLSEFVRDRQGKDGHVVHCKTCRNTRMKSWYKKLSAERRRDRAAKNIEWYRRDGMENKHKSRLKLYGLTPDQYRQMLEVQKHKCLICGRAESGSRGTTKLVVDHDHATGKVRGLLCVQCNGGIGFFSDNTENLWSAISYLDKSLYTHGDVEYLGC